MFERHPKARGHHYTTLRGASEAVLRLLYAGDWAARLWARWPGAGRVERVRVRVNGFDPVPEGARLRGVFLSDLHLGPTTAERTLRRAVELANTARPELLLLGGDYVFLDASRRRCGALTELVRSIDAGVKLAVWGNHDLWTDHARLQRALERAGVRVLVNEWARLPAPWEHVVVHGLDDPLTGEPCWPSGDGRPDAAVYIGVAHSPDGVPLLDGVRPSLFLCGHTHGGHIALPGGRPLVVPGTLGWAWPHGVHRSGPTTVVVSRGIGGIELPVRAFAPPDVVQFLVG